MSGNSKRVYAKQVIDQIKQSVKQAPKDMVADMKYAAKKIPNAENNYNYVKNTVKGLAKSFRGEKQPDLTTLSVVKKNKANEQLK